MKIDPPYTSILAGQPDLRTILAYAHFDALRTDKAKMAVFKRSAARRIAW